MSQFEYEFIFTAEFDSAVFANAPISDKSAALEDAVRDEVSKIVHVLSLYAGVNTMSSTVHSGDFTYKVTVKRS